MKRTLTLAVLAAGCAATDVPPVETAYFREQTAIAHARPTVASSREATALAGETFAPLAAAESARVRDFAETEGVLDLRSSAAAAFLARLAEAPGAALTERPLDLERLLLAVWALNPGVAAARADWSASIRSFEQATYLGDLVLRRKALASSTGDAARAPGFAYPGVGSLQGEIAALDASIAREHARTRLVAAAADAARAFHEASHHAEETAIREEEVELAERMVAAAKSMVESGMRPQAELYEAESDLAMSRSALAHAKSALAKAHADIATLLGRAPGAPVALMDHAAPPEATPELAPLLDLARRFAPEIRIARADADRSAAAIRLAERMASASSSEMPASVGELAWIAEMRERHAGLVRAADEAVRAAERRVVAAHYELDAARRMVTETRESRVPLAKQAFDERLRLYDAGRGGYGDVLVAARRYLDARHDLIGARHDYGFAEAALWSAAGARPEVVR